MLRSFQRNGFKEETELRYRRAWSNSKHQIPPKKETVCFGDKKK